MFIIILTYKKPLEIVDKNLAEHRKFLEKCYQNNFFIASGPRNPRTGGIIISQLDKRTHLENILKQDPFKYNNIADYEIIEFKPSMYHENFAAFVQGV